jgi:hypothetical protein
MERTPPEASGQLAISVPLPCSPRTLLGLLVGIAVTLAAVSFALKYARFELDVDATRRIERWLDVDREAAVPAWFSSSLLLAASVVTASLNHSAPETARSRFWLFLAVVLLGLSIDESIALHERIGVQLHRLLDTGGPLRYAWVIPGTFFVAVIALASLGALRKLPRQTARLMVFGGALYVGGAVGFELVGSQLSETRGIENLAYAAEVSVEEFLEMVGMSVFLFSVISYLAAARVSPHTRVRSAVAARDGAPP